MVASANCCCNSGQVDRDTHVEDRTTEEANELENHVLLLRGQFVPTGALTSPLDLHVVEAVPKLGVEPVRGGDEVALFLASSSATSLPPWLLLLDCLLLDINLGVGIPVGVDIPDQAVCSVRMCPKVCGYISPRGNSRSVFIHVLSTTALGSSGSDIQVGVHVLGFRKEVTRLQIIVVLLPQRLGSMRGAVLAESHDLLEVGSHMPEEVQASCRGKEEKNNRRDGGSERRGWGGRRRDERVRARTDLKMGRRMEEILICCGCEVFLLCIQGEFL
jgi:hypothetical protein